MYRIRQRRRLPAGMAGGRSIVLGLAIAISSTAVATKQLEASGQLQTETGRIVLGWLVVQDIIVIVALVLLPTMSRGGADLGPLMSASARRCS